MEQDFQSLSKGVFVIPYEEREDESQPGPSRPLKPFYDQVYQRYVAAYEAYESERVEEQLDDISDWLTAASAPPLIPPPFTIYRLPVAVIQNISSSLPPLLSGLVKHAYTLSTREAADLSSATRAVAVGFMGEALSGQGSGVHKASRSPIEALEQWYVRKKDRPPLLLHIQDAQILPPGILSELIYIMTLHPNLPFRILVSVPSISTFLSSWSHIEPSSIDISVLHSGRRRREGGVNAILKAATDRSSTLLAISAEFAEELRQTEEMTGGGAAETLKALKWALLRHSVTSPLASLAEESDGSRLEMLRQLIKGMRDSVDVPGKELFTVESSTELHSTFNPAPRISILHALADPSAFIKPSAASLVELASATGSASRASAKGKANEHSTDTEHQMNGCSGEDQEQGGVFKELELLYSLWQSAGKSINLWDWLEGFRDAMTEHADVPHPDSTADDDDHIEGADNLINGHARKRKHRSDDEEEQADGVANQTTQGEPVDEERDVRLHAAFVRFCEESRMLGLVRGKGKGVRRRGDEVVKGIGLL
ncbi:hypothetical protein TREMEDRAFT_68038 [Tremella mesenterica DSM 1558]|uniref:uncharacterized protein n=1 Tax=Tremella mesenterica (strain ATCC 24925 / CBS 8224 / DSM 1558 / NBRC 9311 / NRRL Y-6157 / RJB 2259-6 / UBC 559-6) TaxID=578456 RepID=UPI0003F490FC|nr:uncharacterized protein TREMEDRAFT_68038 [Tremella mesenterica DSM 1558]EIW70408.1 hypothetical protein TREMEDRAFT_68038 [Tremella mesenterica DSM 1558]